MIQQPSMSDDGVTALLAPLHRFNRVVLAVSGGPDSMALLYLAGRWVEIAPTEHRTFHVVTVDHRLRPGSRSEAEWVAAQAQALGFSHDILTWAGDKPLTGVQDAARIARYSLLADFAAATGANPTAVVTAHTLDDQAETVLMRLARGSGTDGLAAMRPERVLDAARGVFLARPLLGLSKAQLMSDLTARGGAYLEDPSNSNDRFERVRLRQIEPHLREAGLTAGMLALTAQRSARARDALEAATSDLADRVLNFNGGAFARLDAALFLSAPEDLQIRLMTRVLRAYGGAAPEASLAQIEQLTRLLAQPGSVRTTLGGCVIRACPKDIRVFRELGRTPLPEMTLHTSTPVVWDNRFRISVSFESCGPSDDTIPVSIRALAPAHFAKLRRSLTSKRVLPARAAATLPAIWQGHQLLAVPALGLTYLNANRHAACSAGTKMDPIAVNVEFIYDGRAQDDGL